MTRSQRFKAVSASDGIAAFSAILSVVALGVSIRGCAISENLANESHLQFTQERKLILTASFPEQNESGCGEWHVKPIAEGFQYQEGRIYLPPRISKEPVYIDASGTVRFMRGACSAMQKFAKNTMPSQMPNYVSVKEQSIPIIVRSFYAVKGEVYDDESIYVLHGFFGVPHGSHSTAQISLDGLSFWQRREPQETVDTAILDKVLMNGKLPLPQ